MGKLRRAKYKLTRAIRELWKKTIGFRLALWLDKKFPDWCWADICTTIGLGYDILDWRKAKQNSCREDCEEQGSCWCGKMVRK